MNVKNIGETFSWCKDPDTTVLLKVVEDAPLISCNMCYFRDLNCLLKSTNERLGPCAPASRPDNKHVHFEVVK